MNAPCATPHAPLGSGARFHFGPPGVRAGYAFESGDPVVGDVFVGCRPSATEAWRLLPAFAPRPNGPASLPRGRYGRFLAAAGDKWMIGPLVFKLCSPFGIKPNSDERLHYAPVVCGYLEYENTHSDEAAELMFGLGADGHRLDAKGAEGFLFSVGCGFATAASDEISLTSGAELFGPAAGPVSAIRFTVPARSKRVFPLVLGWHHPGCFHAGVFADLSAVLVFGLSQHARYLALADERDAEFMRSMADPAVKARATEQIRHWLAQSRRLAGEPPLDVAPLAELWRTVTG